MASVVLSTLPVGLAQPTAAPAFEVASVKAVDLPPGTFPFGDRAAPAIHISGNRVTTRASISGLVLAAYDLKGFQISSAPDWTDRRGRLQLYDISAKTEGEGTPTLDQVRQMLRTMLADRFQLKLHSETKELPVYDLVVGKNGPKLKESAGDTSPPRPATFSGPLIRLNLSNTSMADLIRYLGANVDRPVLDKTGLTGRYDFTLEFTRSPGVALDSPDADNSIFSAVQLQLGLKLVAAKEPTEIFVVDHAERPSAN